MIVVDDREKESVVVRQLQKMGVELSFQHLEIGDYILGDVVIERKEVNDYVSSLIDGRLQKQLYHLSYHYPYSILIVEGYVEEVLLHRKIHRSAYLSSLASAIYKRAPEGQMGVVSVLTFPTPFDTSLFLYHLHKKIEEGGVRLPVIVKKKGSLMKERVVNIVCSLPGISEVKAKRLLQKFKSVHRIVNASVKELMEVDGIGEKTAKEIYEVVRYEIDKTDEI
ncbi:MAG: ERCC4 domain-containing protein [Thermoplasmata archaeon]